MEMSVGEFLDRFSIVILKYEYLGNEVLDEYYAYDKEFHRLCEEHSEWGIPTTLGALIKVNKEIWGYESSLRQGNLGEYDSTPLKKLPQERVLELAAVGLQAVNIRNANLRRKRVVNDMVEKSGSGFKDVKVNHASAEVKVT